MMLFFALWIAALPTAMRWFSEVPGPHATGHAQEPDPPSSLDGDARTGLFLLGLDEAREATIITDFYHRLSGGPLTVVRTHVRPESFGQVYLPGHFSFPSGVYSAIVKSDRPLGSVVYTDWVQSKAFAGHEAAPPGRDIVVPFVAQAWSGRGRSTQVNVQNTQEDEPIEVEWTFHDASGQSIASGRLSLSPGNSKSVQPVIPPGLVGSLRLRADYPVAASAFVAQESPAKGAAAFQASPVEHASDRLFAPEVSAMVELVLSNPGDRPVGVEVFYRRNADASGEPCAFGSGEVAHFEDPVRIPANGSLRVSASDVLPVGCGASAAVRADGPLLGVALVGEADDDRASAYNLSSMAEAGRDLVLPLYRNRYDPRYGFTTWIEAMNLAEVTATMRLEVWEGFQTALSPIACDACTVEVGPGASYRFDPGVVPGLRDHEDMFGAAMLRSDQPVIAVVEDRSLTGAFDTASYRGVAMCAPEGGPAPEFCGVLNHVPWAAKTYLREWAILLPVVHAP